MKVLLLIFVLFSLAHSQKSLIQNKIKKTNQDTTDTSICIFKHQQNIKLGDIATGQEIGNKIFDKLVTFRKEANIKTALIHNDLLASQVQNMVETVIKNPDLFYIHDGFETRASSDDDVKYISESYARLYKYDNPEAEAFNEWLGNSDIEQSFLREYDEGESFCCEAGSGWYCAVLLAKYKTKYS